MVQKACANTWCQQSFEITDDDLAFYENVSPLFGGKKLLIPPPTLCPPCRQQRRISWRNERSLHRRPCTLCKREHVSIYSPDTPCKPLCQECWWSDRWDRLAYGRDIDFGRPFFDQFGELMQVAGVVSAFGRNNINSEYVNQETDDKNCYLNVGGHFNEDCYYCTYSIRGKNNVDCFWVFHNCELCYECVFCERCYGCTECKDCESCTDCLLCQECTGCANCFGCFGLKHKEYHFLNKPLDPKEYRERLRAFGGSRQGFALARQQAAAHILTYPRKAAQMIQCENSSGDYLRNCRNMTEGYLFENAEDSRYGYIGLDVKNCADVSSFGWAERCYEVASSLEDYHTAFCTSTIRVHESYYNFVCENSDHLFGCIGLNRNQYCILNKQYTKDEYETLVPKIIEHMRKTPYQTPSGVGTGQAGEWGEFFPIALSPFCYNETAADDYFPLAKEEVLRRGWLADRSAAPTDGIAPLRPDFAKASSGKQGYGGQPPLRGGWKRKEYDALPSPAVPVSVPDAIADVEDDILAVALTCEVSGRPYRLIKQELGYYRLRNLPVPRRHPLVRHRDRLARQNPWCMWERTCKQCGRDVRSSFAPERPEIVYCEHCYLKEVY